MFDIDRCSGSIFLTDSMNARRITVSGDILLENLIAEGTLAEWVFENSLGSAEQVALWERLLL